MSDIRRILVGSSNRILVGSGNLILASYCDCPISSVEVSINLSGSLTWVDFGCPASLSCSKSRTYLKSNNELTCNSDCTNLNELFGVEFLNSDIDGCVTCGTPDAYCPPGQTGALLPGNTYDQIGNSVSIGISGISVAGNWQVQCHCFDGFSYVAECFSEVLNFSDATGSFANLAATIGTHTFSHTWTGTNISSPWSYTMTITVTIA